MFIIKFYTSMSSIFVFLPLCLEFQSYVISSQYAHIFI